MTQEQLEQAEEQELPRFSTENLPGDPEEWPAYRKTPLTHMKRIEGPFVVETSEGELRCDDGFLAIDSRGYPYPIATDEHGQIYVEADDEIMLPLSEVTVDKVIQSKYREEIHRALNERIDSLEKLRKKEEGLGVITDQTDRTILRAKRAREIIIGQGAIFEDTPLGQAENEVTKRIDEDAEEEAEAETDEQPAEEEVTEDAEDEEAEESERLYTVEQDAHSKWHVINNETGELMTTAGFDSKTAAQERADDLEELEEETADLFE